MTRPDAPRSNLRIAQPGRIGSFALKNRVIMAPMGTNFSTSDGISSERDKRYYEERALGGVAMIMTEAMPVSQGARNHHNSMCVYHDRFIPGLASVVDAIHKHDCYVVGQLSHRGGLLRRSVLGMEPVGPSDWVNPNTGDLVRALSVDEIRAIQQDFVAAARRMQQAGYDGFEIHAANGYLFHQFFTQRINKRHDQYGGSVENRMRLLTETVARIRDALPDFPAFIRISATEYIPGGYTMDDVIALAQGLERQGVAALDLSGGTNESPELSRYCIQPPSMARGCLMPYAKQVKDAVRIPVIVAGRLISPADAEAALVSESADFVSLGRALYADPHWCRKAFGEIDAPIRECISCNVCFERLTLEQDVCCVQNPMVGTEFESIEFAEPQTLGHAALNPRRVLVVGSGVAGLEAARAAAALGNIVEVWEARSEPGGQMALAVSAPDKQEVWPIWTYRQQILQRLGVPIRTGKTATLESVQAFGADLVVLAAGSRPRPLGFDFSALDPDVRIMDAWEGIRQAESIPAGCQVTIIGGGMVGIELADMLIGHGCQITIVEVAAAIAPAMARNNRSDILLRLKAAGVRILLRTRIESARGHELSLTGADESITIDAGSYIFTAIGPKAERRLSDELKAARVVHVLVGDCQQPGDFMAAVRDGFFVGTSLQTRFGKGAAPGK